MNAVPPSNAHWVVLSSANGSTNLGDEAMWEASVSALRSVVGHVPVVTDGQAGFTPRMSGVRVLPYLHLELRRGSFLPSSQVERLVSYPWRNAFAVRRAREMVFASRALGPIATQWQDAIGSARGVVISGAGAMSDDFAPHGVVSWWVVTRWAAARGVPVILLGQGIGPLVDPMLRDLAAEIISYATVVNVREQESATIAAGLAPEARTVVTPDWAILNEPSAEDRERAADYLGSTGAGRPFVALSAHRRHTTHRHQLKALSGLFRGIAERFVSEGGGVVFVPNMTGTRYSDDRATFDLLARSWPAHLRSAVHVVREALGPRVTRAVLGQADLLLTTRYHPLVFAMAEGTATVGISYDAYYDQKLSGASSMFGVRQNVRHVEDADVSWVLHAATTMSRPRAVATDSNLDVLRQALQAVGDGAPDESTIAQRSTQPRR